MIPQPTLEFCEQLFSHGILTAHSWRAANPDQLPAVHELIRSADHLARLDAPGQAPLLDLEAAQWSLSLLAWSVSLLVDRAQANTSLPPELANTEPLGDLPCHHWSVDLAFRYLGEVLLRAKAAASEDRLVVELGNICARWPLASVGAQIRRESISSSDSASVATTAALKERPDPLFVIMNDECLRGILLDRIIARNDRGLAEEPSLRRYIEARKANC